MEASVANRHVIEFSRQPSVYSETNPMKPGKMKQIAISGRLHSPHMFHLLKGVQNACQEEGYHLILHFSEPASLLLDRKKMWEQRELAGVIGLDEEGHEEDEWAKYVTNHSVPYVSLGGYAGNPRIATAMTAHDQSIELALNYLWEQTRLPPVFVLSRTGREEHADRQRLDAYRRWMECHGMRPNAIIYAEKEETRWIESLPLPSAILTNTARDAVSIYRAAAKLDIPIGRGLYVMAADNIDNVNEHLVPALSSVEVPYVDLGYAAAKRLFSYLEGERDRKDTQNIVLEAKMFKGESTGSAVR